MVGVSISIAMTTFNGARFLSAQLASLSSQSVLPLELVVCDDGSSDQTVSLLHSFAAQSPFPVSVIQNAERLGYEKNFIKAASLCRGSVIAFCDQDDIWESDKLAVLVQHFSQSDDLLISHDYQVFFDDGRPTIRSYFHYLSLSGLSPVVNVKGCSLIFRRELIEMVGWPSEQSGWPHDMWVCFTALLLERRGYIRQSLIKYRMHASNTSGWLPGGKARLYRLLRSFRLPPFTGSADLETFIAQFVAPADVPRYREAVRKCRPAMSHLQRQRALSALAKRLAICNFIISETYLHPVKRTLGAMYLFIRRAYRYSDGVYGLVQDILGRRARLRQSV
jgi:glycosyltransferase involved in cell wall biosynthesis